MLSATNISKELGGRALLANISFNVNRGEVLGIVGPNGSGKTTLLRILAGDLAADSGRVETPRSAHLGYLRQGWAGRLERTIGELMPAVFVADSTETDFAAVSAQLATATDLSLVGELEARYDALVAQMAAAPGTAAVDATRSALGLRDITPESAVAGLSGGELTKLALLEVAAAVPGVLLLDEPTNHLDVDGIEWVQAYIRDFAGPVVVVSHDRALLDACATQILELSRGTDLQTSNAELFTGGYTAYAEEKARREEEQWDRYRRQQREERDLRRTISAIESRARNIENSTIDFYVRKRAAKVARRSVTLKARLERQAQSSEHIDRPDRAAQGFHGGFQLGEPGSARVLFADHLALDVAGRRLFDGLSFSLSRGERLVVMGPNGCGKTTLVRAILGQHPVASGLLEVSGSASVGYLAQQDDEAMEPDEAGSTPIEVLRRAKPMTEVDAYNFLHRFLFGRDTARTAVASLSYGERRRLSLARLVLSEVNLLLLDEPTNHLDLPSREAFEMALAAYEGAALIITHDRYFIERFADGVVIIP